MEELQKMQSTATQTQVQSDNSDEKYIIYPALFIKFAEYLGYVSKLLDWCDSWVSGKEPEEFKKKIIYVDAQNIYKQMLADIGEAKIREYYDAFYEVILYEWDEALDKLEYKLSES